MMNFLKNNKKKENDLSYFFRETSSRDKKKVFKKVIREATEDQRKLLNRKTLVIN